MQITNGTVERVYKPGDYESRRVALSFNIDPGEDLNAVLAHVAGLAEHHARQAPGTVGQQVAQVPPTPPAPARGRKGAAAPSPESAPQAFATPPVAATTGMAPGGFPATDGVGATAPMPVSPSEPVQQVPPTPATAVPVSSAAAPTGPSPSPVAADPRLTDQALSEACAAKVNGSADKQTAINGLMALRAEYTGNPALTVAAIPMERRAEFLTRLQAL